MLAANGEEITPIMGSYGIGIERILGSRDRAESRRGRHVPARSIAPFTVIVTPVNNADAALREAARRIYDDCIAAGIDALYDDRDERPGVKFKDADLIGVPYRITIGKKLAQGAVELDDAQEPHLARCTRRRTWWRTPQAIDEEFAPLWPE